MPKYASNAPSTLRMHVILSATMRRIIAKWLPFTIRSSFAASLWLLVAPLLTAYLYHGWMARPSIVLQRILSRKMIVNDLISGGVVASFIIISFLSLMSFADFLRLELHQQQQRQGDGRIQNNRIANRRRDRGEVAAADENDLLNEMGIDDGIWDDIQLHSRAKNKCHNVRLRPLLSRQTNSDGTRCTLNQDGSRALGTSNEDLPLTQGHENPTDYDDDDDDDDDEDEDYDESEDSDNADSWESGMYRDDEDMDEDMDNEEDNNGNINDMDPLYYHPGGIHEPEFAEGEEIGHENRNINGLPLPQQERPRDIDEVALPQRRQPRQGQQNDGVALLDQEDPLDMDINIALDELFGIRGPLIFVARNLLWLLAFNAVYLGFFAFVPRTIGVAISSIIFNTTNIVNASSILHDENNTESLNDTQILLNSTDKITVVGIWRSIETESIRHDTAFRLHDIVMVALGYASIATAIVTFRYLWILILKLRSLRNVANQQENDRGAFSLQDAFDEMNRIAQDDDPLQAEHADVAIRRAFEAAVDVTVAIVKVGVLLFLKMFFLPIVLGIALDASTMSLFGRTLEDCIKYAGRDIFSFILLHWVAGISFMLIVTVSVLQLREVAHPELLSQMIRPQEPHPDLLGNLMNESVSTHSKRMVLSLIIYAFLLAIHVYFPVRFCVDNLIDERLKTYLRLHFCYILPPQLQVPIELVLCHLCMLVSFS
jgi:E3 ubiquitin-protein ligase MARCH6